MSRLLCCKVPWWVLHFCKFGLESHWAVTVKQGVGTLMTLCGLMRVQSHLSFSVFFLILFSQGETPGPVACCSTTNPWAPRTPSSYVWRQQRTRRLPLHGWLPCTRLLNCCMKLGTSDAVKKPSKSQREKISTLQEGQHRPKFFLPLVWHDLLLPKLHNLWLLCTWAVMASPPFVTFQVENYPKCLM